MAKYRQIVEETEDDRERALALVAADAIDAHTAYVDKRTADEDAARAEAAAIAKAEKKAADEEAATEKAAAKAATQKAK